MKFDTIVTRHSALIDYLNELGLVDENTQVVDHVSQEMIIGRHVCGVLPHSLSALTMTFTEIPLNIPQELRGQELSLAQVKEFAGDLTTYRVFKTETFGRIK